MTFRPSVLTSVFTAARQAALAALSLLVVAPQARGDLEWFEWNRGGSMDAITLAEVIAWSDACLDVPQDQWPAVEALHATYRRTVNLAPVSADVAEQAFFEKLTPLLGADRASCISAFTATRHAMVALSLHKDKTSALRRGMLAISAMKSPSPIEAQRVATDLCAAIDALLSSEPSRDYLFDTMAAVQRIFLTHRLRIETAVGATRADEIQLGVLRLFDNCMVPLLSPNARALVRRASKLSDDERANVRSAYDRADAQLRDLLITGRGMPPPGSATAFIDEELGTLRFTGRSSCTAKSEIGDALKKALETALGSERAALLTELSLDVHARSFSRDDEGIRQSEVALETFVDRADFEALATEVGGRFWQPFQSFPRWEGLGVGVPHPIEREMITALVTGEITADERAVLDALHADHLSRWKQTFQEPIAEEMVGRVPEMRADFSDALDGESTRVLDEVSAAVGAHRITKTNAAIFLLARAESCFSPQRARSTSANVLWLPATAGSTALVAMGVAQFDLESQGGIRPLHAELVKKALAIRADVWSHSIRSEWDAAIAARRKLLKESVRPEMVDSEKEECARIVAQHRKVLTRIEIRNLCATFERQIALLESLEGLTDPHGVASARELFDVWYGCQFNELTASKRLATTLATMHDQQLRSRALACLQSHDETPSATVRIYLTAAIAIERAHETSTTNPHEEERRTAAEAAVRAQQVDVVTRIPSNTARAWRLLREAGEPAAKDIFVP